MRAKTVSVFLVLTLFVSDTLFAPKFKTAPARVTVTAEFVELGQAVVAIEEEDVSLSRELHVPSGRRHPDEDLRGDQNEAQPPRRIGIDSPSRRRCAPRPPRDHYGSNPARDLTGRAFKTGIADRSAT